MVFRELLHPSSDLVLEKYSCRVGIDDVLSLTEPVRPLPFRELSRGGRSSERGSLRFCKDLGFRCHSLSLTSLSYSLATKCTRESNTSLFFFQCFSTQWSKHRPLTLSGDPEHWGVIARSNQPPLLCARASLTGHRRPHLR